MLEFFLECISVATGIILVYGGCKLINRLFDGRAVPCGIIKVKNFVADKTTVEVKLSDGRVLSGQQFVGFADFGNAKNMPYQMKSWLVLESDAGRTYIRPESVRVISEAKKLTP